MADMMTEPGRSRRPVRRSMALTHRGLNQSVELTESSYQQAFERLFRIVLASGYDLISNMTLA
jgi:hypothetical protein